jgi:hypothetical protein
LGATGVGIAMLKTSTDFGIYPLEYLEMLPAITLTTVGSLFTFWNMSQKSCANKNISIYAKLKEKAFSSLTREDQELVIKENKFIKENPNEKIISLREKLAASDSFEIISPKVKTNI